MTQRDDLLTVMAECWKELYPARSQEPLSVFFEQLETLRKELNLPVHEEGWHKDAIVYSLYVDLFNVDFPGLESRLEYLKGLGVNCLWLLPILDSPMRDAGFDISDYRSIRHDLLGLPASSSAEEKEKVFVRFLEKAHGKGIRVIFDIALNHTSDEHPWFRASRSSKDNPMREYYIWNSDDQKYKDARIIFKGLCHSNWEKDGEEYFFHRFFEFQPDLNYRNPAVLTGMAGHLLYWLSKGVDGFRADAIPYIWKEEGTACENLPQTHTLIRFIRAALDYVRPHTLLLAEACQKPHLVVEYFGKGDECNAGYHFPLMPQLFKAVAQQQAFPIVHTLSLDVTPPIPDNAQWFTFLRCHDELSLELVYVSEEDRKYIHESYCRKPEWDFRLGQGISARLAELMDRDPRKISLIYSIMLTLPGTPVIYYGDEFGKLNDGSYYQEMIKVSGKDDTRFLVRGKINWDALEDRLGDMDSLEYKVFSQISAMISERRKHPCFGRGDIHWMVMNGPDGSDAPSILSFVRTFGDEKILLIHNLSDQDKDVSLEAFPPMQVQKELLGKKLSVNPENNSMQLPAFGYFWIPMR